MLSIKVSDNTHSTSKTLLGRMWPAETPVKVILHISETAICGYHCVLPCNILSTNCTNRLSDLWHTKSRFSGSWKSFSRAKQNHVHKGRGKFCPLCQFYSILLSCRVLINLSNTILTSSVSRYSKRNRSDTSTRDTCYSSSKYVAQN